MIIYGMNPVREALKAHPNRIRFIAVSRESNGKIDSILAVSRAAGVAVRKLSSVELDRMTGRKVHNGVVAEVSEVAYADFDEIIALESTTFVLLLDAIQDPQNLGAILRVADSFGVNLVVLPEHESVGVTAAAVKASAGAAEWVTIAHVTNLSRAVEELKKREFWVYGTAAGGESMSEIDFRGKVALVLGSEGKGVRRNVLEHCDRQVAIPMRGHVESLNVAAAAAVLCYEVMRQNRSTL